ncbi:hypothetical protein POX_a01662 [Penicillium oxalicum]|uniref:hypothetical protein n=1 Tax=Penicillium oxalicum TaxID=69781 RepID=UPI0020B889DC|nr:hypothetical protein POX_a01662 [Penicillium oxalicum]KAI2795059.1 hypothetical protein POX_a01662 [Penicillium oxalicum]
MRLRGSITGEEKKKDENASMSVFRCRFRKNPGPKYQFFVMQKMHTEQAQMIRKVCASDIDSAEVLVNMERVQQVNQDKENPPAERWAR